MGLVTFLIVLSVLVFVHELGHFLAAKFFGVKVHVFSIGFGRKIYAKEFRGTLWQLSLIPLGGYVKMKGQDDSNPALAEKGEDSFNEKKPWQRIIILFAGAGANFLLAAFLYFFIAIMGVNTLSPTIGQISPNSPAELSGLKNGDEIVRINDKEIKTWNEIGKYITASNTALTFYVKRENALRTFVINPQVGDSQNIFKEQIKKRMIGISPAPKVINIKYNLGDALKYAYDSTIQSSLLIFQGVQKLIQGVVPSSEIGGVITIGKVISDASQSGIVALFTITALISVNLGVLNLLPIPALDGGHIMFNLYEMFTRRKPSEKILIILTIFGWMVLGALMLLGIFNDINRLMQG